MKVESREIGDLFKPIVIEITIESEKELTVLYNRINAPLPEVMTKDCTTLYKYEDVSIIDDPLILFNILQHHMERLQLDKPAKKVG